MLDQNQSDNQFDLGGLKDVVSKKMEDVGKALDDKDKQILKDHVETATEAASAGGVTKKVGDTVKTVDKVVNSPEAKIVGAIIGPEASDKLKSAGKIVSDIANNPLLNPDQNKGGDQAQNNKQKPKSLSQKAHQPTQLP